MIDPRYILLFFLGFLVNPMLWMAIYTFLARKQ
jgi:hypothetical protein